VEPHGKRTENAAQPFAHSRGQATGRSAGTAQGPRRKAGATNLPIFQAGNGQPLNLDNIARRVIAPALSRCQVCRQPEAEHKAEGHLFERDEALPEWHGWHAFRRGLATNLHKLGVADKDIQAILRHSNLGLTMNVYVKSVNESQVNAMDSLSETFGIWNVHGTSDVKQ